MLLQGFPSQRASKAVIRTHNCGVEPAVNWLMEHSSDADIDVPLELAVNLLIPDDAHQGKIGAFLHECRFALMSFGKRQ